jgi:TorA maturation chaperone TorD
MTAQARISDTPDEGEEAARADMYSLLATLFYAPPEQELLDTIGRAVSPGESMLQQVWNDLADACARTGAEQAREEYETLFVGLGKPELMLYASYYLSGFLMEKPLAALRTDLSALGLARDPSMPESEDHIAALCEVMRYLITSDDIELASLETQKQFYGTHLQPWVTGMCEAVMQHPQAAFYSRVAAFAKHFLEVETLAFDMT